MSYETIELTVEGNGVATVLLNRPQSRNALNVRMCSELVSVTEQIEQDERIRVVVFRGAGPAFCAGADLKERKDMTLSDMTARRVAGFAAYDAIEKLSRPAIALVHGPAFGSGCEIIAACDFAWATPEATFRYPELSWVRWALPSASAGLPEFALPRNCSLAVVFSMRRRRVSTV